MAAGDATIKVAEPPTVPEVIAGYSKFNRQSGAAWWRRFSWPWQAPAGAPGRMNPLGGDR